MYSNLQIIKQGYFSLLDGLLQDIYKPCDCPACQSEILQLSQGDTLPFKQILNTGEKAFKKLHKNQKYHPRDLDKVKEYQQLITQTSDFLQTTISQDIPKELQQYLKKDSFIFSGLRTHAQLTQARQYLLDSDGVPVPYQQFERNILKINKQYNRQYLKAEYLFAQQSAQSAANWQNLQDDTDRYLLQYRTAQDDKVRASHQPLHQTTLSKNDPFWNSYYPPNGWRCRCTAVEVLARDYPSSDPSASIQKGETATTQIAKNGQNKLGIFRFNPGKNKVVFPPKHPYNKVVGANIAKPIILTMFTNLEKTNNPINKALNQLQTGLSKQWAKEHIPAYDGLILKGKNFQTGQINYRRKSVKEIVAHNSDPLIKAYPRTLIKEIKNWEYIGWGKVAEGKHTDTIVFTYYKNKIGDKVRYINIKLTQDYGEVPYAITERIDLKILKKGNVPKKYLTKINNKEAKK